MKDEYIHVTGHVDDSPIEFSKTEGLKMREASEKELLDNTICDLVDDIVQWHYDRNLIDGSSDKDQTLKLLQELGELSDSVCKGKDIRDDLGDMMVVMLNIMERNKITLADCLEKAYNDIKDRKGRMVNGVFVKEQDL
jgi:uncharacterized protein YihD (DUF1040 family)